MRLVSLLLLTAILFAQPAQQGIPRIDLIEVYGLKRVTVNLVRQGLGLKEGDPLPASKEDTEERLLDIDRVVSARLQAVCCDDDKTVLYVGIEEFGGPPHYAVRSAPGGAVMLPQGLLAAGQGKPTYNLASALRGRITEIVDDNLSQLREVLRESGDEFHRAAAAYLLPFASRRAEIVGDLQAALTDNDPEVRAHAVRALLYLLQQGRNDPASKIRVQPDWFVPMLISISWTDRTEAASALATLTEDNDRAVFNQLRDEPLAALIEMARWQTRAHAYPSFLLLGRIVGFRDFQIRDAWERAGRETVIGLARTKQSK